MLTKDGALKVIDFGVSKSANAGQKLTTITGTPSYIAPEVLEGKYDSKCDMWSMGVLLYMLMSGYLPFTGSSKS